MSKKVEGDLPPLILLEDLGMLFAIEGSKRKIKFGVYKCGFCETNFKASISNVKFGNTQSCGCYKKRITGNLNKTHGLRNTRLYRIWSDIKSRTLNLKYKN